MIRLLFLTLFFCSCQHDAKKSETTGITTKYDQLADAEDTTVSEAAIMNTAWLNINLVPHKINLPGGDSFYLGIPKKYNIAVAAMINSRLRFLAMSPDGQLFATDMVNTDDNKKGRVIIFENWNAGAKKFESIHTYLGGLHNPNQVAFYKQYIYVAETDRLRRFRYLPSSAAPADTGHTIATFPDYGLSYKYGGWHLTRSLAFFNDKLYVSVGSSCNACIEKETVRASIVEMDPDGSNAVIFASGLRNSVGIHWIGNQLWATGMGRDLIGPDKPEDLFQQVERGKFYGWPYYYQYQGKIFEDENFKDSARADTIKEPPVAFLGFKAHSAPLGFGYFKNFNDSLLNNSILVCLHGSTSAWRKRGNSIVRIAAGNKYTEVVSGFLTGKTDAERHGRPCDILMNDDHSFFFTDDLKGGLYYVWKE